MFVDNCNNEWRKEKTRMCTRTFVAVVPPQVTLFGQEFRPQPPMGLAYILQAVGHAGWEARLLDCCTAAGAVVQEDQRTNWRRTGLLIPEAVRSILAETPDVVGVSLGVSTDHDTVRELVAALKQTAPSLPIVLGGPQASLMGARLFNGYPVERIAADYVVTGRDLASGEETIEGLLRMIENQGNPRAVPGLCWLENGEVMSTSSVLVTPEKLDVLHLPRREMFRTEDGLDIYSKINRSHTGPAEFIPYAVMHTSRGCGGACTFCHIQYAGFNRNLLRRSHENIVRELDWLVAHEYRTVSIEDDNFGGFTPEQIEPALRILDEIRVRRFAALYFPNGLTLRGMNGINFALLRKLRSLADAGIRIRTSLPFECGDDDTLRRLIHKPHTMRDIQAILAELQSGQYLQHPNLELDAFLMVGIVGYDGVRQVATSEKSESIERTMELGRRCASLGIRVNLWWMKPNPGGPQYEMWRDKYPNKPFFELQFLFPSGIWGNFEEEQLLDERIRAFNREIVGLGAGSRRPIYPV